MHLRLATAILLTTGIGTTFAADQASAKRSFLSDSVRQTGSERNASRLVSVFVRGKDGQPDLSLPVDPFTGDPVHTGRILLKVRNDSSIRGSREFSMVAATGRGAERKSFDDVLAMFGGRVRQLLTSRSDEQLREVQRRAEVRTGRPQVDPRTLLVIEVPNSLLIEAANALGGLESVEFVEIERQVIQAQDCQSRVECGGPNTPCNRPRSWGQTAYTALAAANPAAPGAANAWSGPPALGLCPKPCNAGNLLCNPDPGSPGDASSFAGCADLDCCELVSSIPGYEYCSNGDLNQGWDIYCAAVANLLCGGIQPAFSTQYQTIYRSAFDPNDPLPDLDNAYDPCFTNFQIVGDANNIQANPLFKTIAANQALTQSCFTPRDSRGCNLPACCFGVCSIDPLCCDLAWDENCVDLTDTVPGCVSVATAAETPNQALDPQFNAGTWTNLPWANTTLTQWPSIPGTNPAEPKVDLRWEGPWGSGPIDNCVFFQPPAPPAPPTTLQQTRYRTAGLQTYMNVEAVIPGFVTAPDCQYPVPSTLPPGQGPSPFSELSQFRGGGIDLYGLAGLAFDFAEYYQGGGESSRSRIYGGGVRVGFIDLTAHLFHEEFQLNQPNTASPTANPAVLAKSNPSLRVPGWVASTSNPTVGYGQVRLEEGIDQVFLGGDPQWAEHGTAALSTVFAYPNGFGLTGISYQSEGWFFPALGVDSQNPALLSPRLADAIISATVDFSPGDILCLPISFADYQPCTTGATVATLLSLANASGIIAVVSAGNGGIPVAESGTGEDTGAIIVGSLSPGSPLIANIYPNPGSTAPNCRISSSNFTNPEDPPVGGEVQLAGWGDYVLSAGIGDLFRGTSAATPANSPQSGPGTLDDANDLRSYSISFGGTSAAASMVAGIAANVQSFTKLVYQDTPVGPETMLGLLRSPRAAVYPTCNQVGNTAIGQFPNDLLTIGYDVIEGNFLGGGQGGATFVEIMTGIQIEAPPNVYQIRQADGVFLKVGTEKANQGQSVRGLVYPLTGHTTDVAVYLQSPVAPGELESVAERVRLRTVARATNSTVLAILFLYNYESSRWDWQSIAFLGSGLGQEDFNLIEFYPPSYSLTQYLAPDSGLFNARIYTSNLGSGSPHQVWYDQIQMILADPTKEP